MMTKTRLHLNNFLLLIEEAGSLTKLARKCGYEKSASLSQLKRRLEEQADDEAGRGIRPSLARKIEAAMHKRKGWLDRDHSKDKEKAESVKQAASQVQKNEGVEHGSRKAEVIRVGDNIQVSININFDGSGRCSADTGVPFLNEMLKQAAYFGLFDLEVAVTSQSDSARRVFDETGIAFGQALSAVAADRHGIAACGYAYAVSGNALGRAVVEFSERSELVWTVDFARKKVERVDTDTIRSFFSHAVSHGLMTLHIDQLRGEDTYRQTESIFKAFGMALAAALKPVSRYVAEIQPVETQEDDAE